MKRKVPHLLGAMGLLASLTGWSCSSSVVGAALIHAKRNLVCDCDERLRLTDVTAKASGLVDDSYDRQRFYQASCCGREVNFLCQALVEDAYSRRVPLASSELERSDVTWRCLESEGPATLKKKAEEAVQIRPSKTPPRSDPPP